MTTMPPVGNINPAYVMCEGDILQRPRYESVTTFAAVSALTIKNSKSATKNKQKDSPIMKKYTKIQEDSTYSQYNNTTRHQNPTRNIHHDSQHKRIESTAGTIYPHYNDTNTQGNPTYDNKTRQDPVVISYPQYRTESSDDSSRAPTDSFDDEDVSVEHNIHYGTEGLEVIETEEIDAMSQTCEDVDFYPDTSTDKWRKSTILVDDRHLYENVDLSKRSNSIS